MALVVLGSRRVTRDFDFVVSQPREDLERLLALLYDLGLELASRVDEAGSVTATITSRKVAAARMRLDQPSSVYFYNSATGLRVDLLFDFPLPAAALAERASSTKIRSHLFHIASDADLLQLKQIARPARSAPGDAEDIAFLEARLATR
jgi:hypothetical protein